jgi:hypothetical protein
LPASSPASYLLKCVKLSLKLHYFFFPANLNIKSKNIGQNGGNSVLFTKLAVTSKQSPHVIVTSR